MATLTQLQSQFQAAVADADAARTAGLRIEADLLQARRADPDRVDELEAALAAAATRRQAAEQRSTRARADLLALAELVTDPVSGLDGEHPIALLPVRIETRFVGTAGSRRLLVRVYPD